MAAPPNAPTISMFASSVSRWVEENVLQPLGWHQIVVIVGTYLPAWLLSGKIEQWAAEEIDAGKIHLRINFEPTHFALVMRCLIWLFLLWFCQVLFGRLQIPTETFRMAVNFLLALLAVRFATFLIKDRFWARVACAVCLVAIGLRIFGLWQPDVHMLNGMTINLGAISFSMWGAVKAIVILAILWVAGAAAGRFFSHWLAGNTHLTYSDRALVQRVFNGILAAVVLLISFNAAAAQIELDEANLSFWRAEVKRYQSAAKAGAVSKEKLDEALTQRSKAVATLAKGRADLENVALDLSFTNITAPFDGRVQETRINIGNLVERQRDVLTTLVQMDPIYVVFNISRARVYEIQLLKREGKVLPVKEMRAEIILPDGSKYAPQGKINFVSFQIDPATDSVLVRAVFPNKHNKEIGDFNLIPGQYAPVRLILGDEPDALLIPQPALVESQIGRQVFVVDQENKVSVRTVEVGRGYRNQWVVHKGLKKDEIVIVEGTQKVKSGVMVKTSAYDEKKKDKHKKS